MNWQDGFAFELDESVRLVQETARNFATKRVAPLAAALDKEHRYPEELVAEMAELGFMGALIPSEYSGSELSVSAYCMAIEELASACASTAVILSAHSSLCVWPIVTYGTLEQKKEYLPNLADGKALGCFALSEPGTGSDAARLTCSVEKRGDKYIINGTKNWITNAPRAGVCVLLAMQDAKIGSKGITAFVHRMDLKGISVGKPEDKLGIRASPTASINYDQVELTKENLLGAELGGFKIAMNTLNGGRLGVAAQAIGIARASLRDALAYSKDRKTFGQAICQHQSIQNYLADMVVRIDAARYLNLGAARLKEQGKSYIRQASMAKLFASETAVECALKCIQIHGGYGYVTDFPAERHLRDSKITEIYEGTSEIQRLIIAGELLRE